MKIKLSGAGKRFNREWIFRHANLELVSGKAYAITGANGSGKSTLLQSIGGMLGLSEGAISYEGGKRARQGTEREKSAHLNGSRQIAPEVIFTEVSFVAPYMEVPEEMTFTELLRFHKGFKSFIDNISATAIIGRLGLQAAAHKQIRYYSSGMKQRVKLALALFSDTEIVLLDEPCSNLDAAGIDLYHSLVQEYGKDRLLIVCSNDEVEYSFCDTIFSMNSFKQVNSQM